MSSAFTGGSLLRSRSARVGVEGRQRGEWRVEVMVADRGSGE